MFTADPSAHVFQGQIYIYPSHDIDAGVKEDDLGSHFAMRDYHVLSQKTPASPVVDHGVALKLEDVAWASKMLWAPDAAESKGNYYLYFPAKDKEGVFRIGVASSSKPEGPFMFYSEVSSSADMASEDPYLWYDKKRKRFY